MRYETCLRNLLFVNKNTNMSLIIHTYIEFIEIYLIKSIHVIRKKMDSLYDLVIRMTIYWSAEGGSQIKVECYTTFLN